MNALVKTLVNTLVLAPVNALVIALANALAKALLNGLVDTLVGALVNALVMFVHLPHSPAPPCQPPVKLQLALSVLKIRTSFRRHTPHSFPKVKVVSL